MCYQAPQGIRAVFMAWCGVRVDKVDEFNISIHPCGVELEEFQCLMQFEKNQLVQGIYFVFIGQQVKLSLFDEYRSEGFQRSNNIDTGLTLIHE